MIIGANQDDFSSVVDNAPPSFGIFFWYSDDFSKNWHAATITKMKDQFVYELRSNTESEPVTTEYRSKADLIKRMETDNGLYNRSRKVTIEF